LGEGYDLLIIDEAQEYTESQETTLKYIVSDSRNPQTIMLGTPPTTVSAGTVFMKYRDTVLAGQGYDAGWAEWSVEKQHMPGDLDAWYETNPSLGSILTERKIRAEITTDDVDFNIQRLGLWIRYNLKSEISTAEWEALKINAALQPKGKLFVGIKYGHDGANVAMSIAVKNADGKIFVETIDCQSVRTGNGWILRFLKEADIEKVVIDGASGQSLLAGEMQDARLKKPILPTVKEVVTANSVFKQNLDLQKICHSGQPSLTQAVSNCERRLIGTGGGFGYRSIKDGIEIALMDSMILAHWACSMNKERRKQKVSY
jgi:hypothetical protein